MNVAGSDEGTSDPMTNLANDQIMGTLEISPFASVRQIARMTFVPKTRIYRRLSESLNFVNKK
jgi:hypothetical protein